ncbi:MAG: hypothetical protein ACUVWN_15785 [bacterium]
MQFLYQTIKEMINTGKIGVPVFVRCIVQIVPKNEYLIDTLAKILMITCNWMEALPIKVYVQSRENKMQITASAQYTGGQNAIISVNTAPNVSPRIDLMMLGNKGALYHDGTSIPPGFDFDFDLITIPEWLINALIRSINSGKPEIIREVENFD